MSYNPRDYGALCDLCPLQGKVVVPPDWGDISDLERLAGTCVAIVGEAPGENEERQKRPFVGASGAELERALRTAGMKRRNALITNSLLCRPSKDNNLKSLLDKISKLNRNREKVWKKEVEAWEKKGKRGPEPEKPEEIPSPVDCCKARLESEIRGFQNFVTLGKTATTSVTGSTSSIMAIRGGLMELEGTERTPHRLVMPTIHPAFALRQRRWMHVFHNDIIKAGRWFQGIAEWKPPEVIYNPSPEVLAQFLSEDKVYTFDLETDGIEALTARIRCVGVGYDTKVLICGFLSKDGVTHFYDPRTEREVQKVLVDFFIDHSRVKASWNGGYYDLLVLQSQWGIRPINHVDGILLHRSVESELPHNLAYAASLYAEAPAWKSNRENEKISTHAESDEQLHEYCAKDVAITSTIVPKLVDQVALRDQLDVFRLDAQVQSVCADMHTVGMYVDQKVRLKKEKELLKRRHDLLDQIRGKLGIPNFNPGSVYQLRDLLFDDGWKLVPPDIEDEDRYTSAGDPSTGDLILRALLTDRTIPVHQRDIIKLVRYYRKVQKVLGTYVVKLRPSNMEIDADLGWDADEDWVDQETRDKYGLVKMGITNPVTGRMHPGWSCHVPNTGRIASSKPINAMNFPSAMRSIVTAAPGHVLVGADMDQLELRFAASHWGVQTYLRALSEGKDPHAMTAFLVFGDAFLKAAQITREAFSAPGILVGGAFDASGGFIKSFSEEAKKLRDLSKITHYSSQYMGSVEAVHKIITKTEVPVLGINGKPLEDGTTDLPYALLPLKKTRSMRENWLKGVPEYKVGWEKELDEFRRQGYLREPVTGRRRDFLDGEDEANQIVNFKIQSGCAGLMNLALVKLAKEIPLHKWGPGTGIINQCHDSIVIECPADGITFDEKGKPVGSKDALPFRVAKLLEECMNQTHPALPGVVFSATAAIGHSWREV